MRMVLALAAAAVATAPNVTKLILLPSQVGTGYVLFKSTDGADLKKTATMNLCGSKGYPSEQLRKARLQVSYLKPKARLGLSNEVVLYRPGGAAQALREANRHAVSCPHHAIDSGEAGLPPLRFSITRLKDPRLLKGYVAVRVRVTGTVKGKHVDQTSYAVYQRLGDVLSGTYSVGPNTRAQQRFALHAAEQSAKNLRRGHNAGSPTA
jgi:hypothetical protein